jgi:hypothetical protein
MNLRVLIIDETTRENIRRLRGYAESNRVSLDALRRMQEHPEQAVGNNPAHAIIIPQSYRVVFSVEEQPAGLAEHLSISVLPPRPNTYPSTESVTQICLEFGWPKLSFEPGQQLGFGFTVWMEPEACAINLLRLVDTPANLLKLPRDHGLDPAT